MRVHAFSQSRESGVSFGVKLLPTVGRGAAMASRYALPPVNGGSTSPPAGTGWQPPGGVGEIPAIGIPEEEKAPVGEPAPVVMDLELLPNSAAALATSTDTVDSLTASSWEARKQDLERVSPNVLASALARRVELARQLACRRWPKAVDATAPPFRQPRPDAPLRLLFRAPAGGTSR